MSLIDMILEAAARMECQGVSVDVVSIRGTVCIKCSGKEDIFLQGDDGSAFISQANANWNEAREVTFNDCYMHLAEPYVDTLWSKT